MFTCDYGKSYRQACLRLFEAAVLDLILKGASSGVGVAASGASDGGVLASEASLPPKASQVVAVGD